MHSCFCVYMLGVPCTQFHRQSLIMEVLLSSDVDLVVHIGCPPSVEQMVQELGRAGRDGRHCEGTGILTHIHHVYQHVLTCIRTSLCIGIVIYRDQDVQHLAYWSRDTDNDHILSAFNSCWR